MSISRSRPKVYEVRCARCELACRRVGLEAVLELSEEHKAVRGAHHLLEFETVRHRLGI